MYAINAHAPPDFTLPHQVVKVGQGLPNSEKQLMRVEFSLEELSQDLNTGHRVSGNR